MTCFDDVHGKLGFGLMRLPKIDGEIDIPQFGDMVDAFLDAGFNYFDTAWAYPGSEEATRKALVERYPRDAFLLATKAAPWFKCNNAQEAYAQLDTVLSEHPEVEFVQLQVNYLDWDNPVHQSHACLEVARKHGKPIVVMEPLRGGLLANPPESVRHVFEQVDLTSSCASWALRFAASQPDVAVVLSGMSDLAQMEANIRTMQDFECMGVEEEAVIARAQDEFAKFDLIPCTGCDYCAKACPANIGISGALLALNAHTMFGSYKNEWIVGGERKNKRKPSECLQCGACEKVCPQQIPIVADLKRAASVLGL